MEDNENKYLNFLPVASEERYGKSVDFLQEELSNPEIHNIGVLGTYGSGKSSLIKTFEDRMAERKIPKPKKGKQERKILGKYYRKVSLAAFSDKSIATKKEVEAEIAQQLFYSSKPNKTRRSKIERIKGFPYTILLVCVLLFLTAIFFGFGYFYFRSYSFSQSNQEAIGFFTASGLALCTAIFFFASSFPLKHVSLSVSQATLEADKENSQDKSVGSFFDEVAPEILYFFEQTKTNIVVFEDIDRLQEESDKYISLLSDLRNLNVLINASPTIKKNRGVAFIYCVKDDCFEKENERVKFFDSIVSIAPIISPYNTAETIISIFDKNIPESEIVALSPFITERRMIHSIKTDFERFFELNNEEIRRSKDYEALFALMVYKNVAPKDFDLFANNNGDSVLYSLLFKSEEITGHSESKLAKKIVEKEYIDKDCHKYISLFQKGLFESRVDKDVFEGIQNSANYDDLFAKIERPGSILSKANPEDMKNEAVLKVVLASFLLVNPDESPDQKKKKDTFIGSFDTPDNERKQFIDDLFDSKNPYEKESLNILASPIGRITWIFNEISKKEIYGKNEELFKKYLYEQFGKNEENCSAAFSSISSSNLSDFFCALEDPCGLLENFSTSSLAYLFGKADIVFTALKAAKKGNVGIAIVEFGAYRKTYENICILCDGIFAKPIGQKEFFASVLNTSNGHLIGVCVEDANSFIDAHALKGRSFVDESDQAANYLFDYADLSLAAAKAFCAQYAQKHSFSISLNRKMNYPFVPLLIEKNLLFPSLQGFSNIIKQDPSLQQSLFQYYMSNQNKAPKNDGTTDEAKQFLISSLALQNGALSDSQIEILKSIPFGCVVDFQDSEAVLINLLKSGHLAYSAQAFEMAVAIGDIDFFLLFTQKFAKEILAETSYPDMDESFALALLRQQKNDQDKMTILSRTDGTLCDEANRQELKSLRPLLNNPTQVIADYFYGYLKKGQERKAYLAKYGDRMSLAPLEAWAIVHEPHYKEWVQNGVPLKRTTTCESASIIRAIAKKKGRPSEKKERLMSIFE